MIVPLVEKLRAACADGPTALWFSGGKDSRLLLELCLRHALPAVALLFDDTFSRAQRAAVHALLAERDAGAFSYPPRFATMVGHGGDLSMIGHYAVTSDGATLPVIRDLIDGPHDRCGLELSLTQARGPLPAVYFPRHILGSKRADRHYAFGGQVVPSASFTLGDAEFVCPLFEWNDDHVLAALAELGIDWRETEAENTGNIACCRKCLLETGEIECPRGGVVTGIDWNAERNLADWRQMVGVDV